MNGDFDTAMSAAIVPLREAGFALHWLHSGQKRPKGKEWSTAPVATLDDLRRTYVSGNNLGVRLGEFSRVADGYLHVVDLDIRIPELADEAWAAFDALGLGDRETFPEVQSGSGGESRHLYLVTEKPFDSRKLALSEGKHRGKDGSWHYDWEIEFFGTGKQVVVPPSIHPDTKKPYIWLSDFDFDALEFGIGPIVPAATIEAIGATETSVYEYESREPLEFKPGQLDRYLDDVPVSDLHYDDWVRLGQALHHQFGGSQEGFGLWEKHTRRSAKFTGESQIREMRRIKWRSFGKWRKQPVTMATVITWAQEARTEALVSEFDDFEGALESQGTGDDDFDDLVAPAASSTDDDFDTGKDEPLPWTSLLARSSSS